MTMRPGGIGEHRLRRWWVALLAITALPGCTLWEGRGKDGSELRVAQTCDVKLDQAAVVSGMDDSATIERVRVNPDCTTEIDFQQSVGDNIDNAGGKFRPVESNEIAPAEVTGDDDGVVGADVVRPEDSPVPDS